MAELIFGIVVGVLFTLLAMLILKPGFRDGRIYTLVGHTTEGNTLFDESGRVLEYSGRVNALPGTHFRANLNGDGVLSFQPVKPD